MASRRSTPNRFARTPTDTGSILSGIEQELDPRFTTGYVKRNLKPYAKYLPSTKPKAYKGKSDAKLRKLAAKAVLGVNHVKRKKPRSKPK